MATWPDALALFARLRELAAPLRLADLDAWVRSLGLAPFPVPCGAFQATPMRHRGSAAGGFFLGGKDGGFTEDDEEVLAVFAQQAAASLANARAHREEQRARADVEALIETCPVGVAVFDAATGTPLSLNPEAWRVVADLDMADSPPETIRAAVVCRRGDGSEATLGDLAGAEMVRGEEVEITVPGGKAVRMLIDATPIRSADGAVERMVVAMRDLAPFEALERSRAEFLGMVSHELRAPLAAIKGSAATALADPRDPDRAELRQYLRIVEEQADRMSGLIGDLLDAGRLRAGTLSVEPVPEDLAGLVERARTAFAGAGRHTVVVELPADLPPVLADRRRVVQVLDNLLANAARHSPETAPIRVAAQRRGPEVEVSVVDDGEGIPPERLAHLFGRQTHAPEGGGSGLGLRICKGLVEAHGGRIRAESAGPGHGTRIVFTLPGGRGREPCRSRSAIAVAARLRENARPCGGRRPARPAPCPRGPRRRRLRAVHHRRTGQGGTPGRNDAAGPGPAGPRAARRRRHRNDADAAGAGGRAGDLRLRLRRRRHRRAGARGGRRRLVVKPYSAAELAARVALALRRRTAPEPFVLGDLAIDRAARRVTVAGQPVRLTATEYRLLHTLSLDAGGATSHEALLRRVWGPGRGNPQALRSAVRKLRSKLRDDARNPKYILGERGLGYRMPAPGQT